MASDGQRVGQSQNAHLGGGVIGLAEVALDAGTAVVKITRP